MLARWKQMLAVGDQREPAEMRIKKRRAAASGDTLSVRNVATDRGLLL